MPGHGQTRRQGEQNKAPELDPGRAGAAPQTPLHKLCKRGGGRGEKGMGEAREANPRPHGARAAGRRAGPALGPKMAQNMVNDGGDGLSCYCVRPDQPDHSRHTRTTHPTPPARHRRVTSGQLAANPSPPEYDVQWRMGDGGIMPRQTAAQVPRQRGAQTLNSDTPGTPLDA